MGTSELEQLIERSAECSDGARQTARKTRHGLVQGVAVFAPSLRCC